MYCKKCGSPLVTGDQFCKKCGEKVENENAQNIGTPNVVQSNINNNATENMFGVTPTIQQNQNYNMGNNAEMYQQQLMQQQPINNNKIMNLVPLILGIFALVSGFLNVYVGIALGIATIIVSIKIKSSYGKKGKIMGIIVTTFFTLYAIGILCLGIFGFTVNDKSLKGLWECSNINSFIYGNYNDAMEFNNGKYIFNLNEVKTTDEYIIKPSKYDKDSWESIKGSIQTFFDITNDKPETFVLDTNNNGNIKVLKFNTTTGEMIFVYTADTYICKR